MPRQRAAEPGKSMTLDFGKASKPQQAFLMAREPYICYGGARGGGKTHIARVKAVGMAIRYPGIKILMVRAHYPELTDNLINPIKAWVPPELYSYNGTDHLMTFWNGSEIKFGHYDSSAAENEYQGKQYHIIFLEEATQLSERAFQIIGGCCRSSDDLPKRIYLTCNPGGVGHKWVKDLFVKPRYRVDPNDPERTQRPEDYRFIPAKVDDNPWLLKNSPMYLKMLANLPDDIRQAHRFGDWDALSGAYFSNFRRNTHTVKRFKIPNNWLTYRSFDYGLDMLAVCWWAVDEDGRSWCYRYYEEKGLIISDAAKAILENTMSNERPVATYAPPDMWNRQKDTGKTMAEIFLENGVAIVKSDNNRVQGHMVLKDMMSPLPLQDTYIKSLYGGNAPDNLPGIMFFDDLKGRDGFDGVIEDLESIQADEKNPNDCAKDPHDVTHSVDACRYYAISRVRRAPKVEKKKKVDPLAFLMDEGTGEENYESYLCGGEITDNYIG